MFENSVIGLNFQNNNINVLVYHISSLLYYFSSEYSNK